MEPAGPLIRLADQLRVAARPADSVVGLPLDQRGSGSPLALAGDTEREFVSARDGQTLRERLPIPSAARFSAYVATSSRASMTFTAEAGSGAQLRRVQIAASAEDGWQPISLDLDPVAGLLELRLSVSGGAGTWGNPMVHDDPPGLRPVVSSVARRHLGTPPAPGAIVILAVSGLDRGQMRRIDVASNTTDQPRFEQAYSVSSAPDESFEALVTGARPGAVGARSAAMGLVAAARAAGYVTLAVLQDAVLERGSPALAGFETRVFRSGPWTATLDELEQRLAAAEPYPVLALARVDLEDSLAAGASVAADLAARIEALRAAFDGHVLICVAGLPPEQASPSLSVRGAALNLAMGIRWDALAGGPGPLDWPVSVIDLAPTVADLAGFGSLASVEGQSLVPLIADPTAAMAWGLERRAVYAQSPQRPGAPDTDRLAMIIRDGWKLIRDPSLPLGYALHDMLLDPDDRNDVAARHPRLAARLAAELDAWLASQPASSRRAQGAGDVPRAPRRSTIEPAVSAAPSQAAGDSLGA